MILINQDNEIISGKSHPILESDKTVLKTYFFCHKGGGRSGLIPISESNYFREKGSWSLVKVSKELKKLGFETRNHHWKVEGCNFRGESNLELKNTIFGIKFKKSYKSRI